MIIQIGMLLVGLVAIISGQFGWGKTIYLKGKKARIAGLILLIPILFTICSILLMIAADLTDGLISAETLERELGNSERGIWIFALATALAYVNFHITPRETKTHSGCLKPWLVFISLGAFVSIYYLYSAPNFRESVFPSSPSWISVVLSIISVLQVIFCVAIWRWKKWGIFGYITSVVMTTGIGLTVGVDVLPPLLGLSDIVVIGLLVKPRWQFFD